MSDPLEKVFDEFADETEASLNRFAERIEAFRTELNTMREEQRSAPVLATQPTIDTDAIATRAAQLVPQPQNGVDGKDGAPGKDAVVDYDQIIARVVGIVTPVLLEKIPAPVKGEKGERGEPGPQGERGEDGLSAPEDMRDFVRNAVVEHFSDFYQGVWTEKIHKRGISTTWGGSLWISTRETNARPGTDDSWKLAVKAGRDGKK